MTHIATVPGGASRPGRRPQTADSGAVTVEAAFAIVGLVAVVLALAWCLGLLGAQLAVGEAARAAARSAARGDDQVTVTLEARRLVPGSSVVVRVDGDHLVVEVSRDVQPPGGLARWGSVHLSAESVAAREMTP